MSAARASLSMLVVRRDVVTTPRPRNDRMRRAFELSPSRYGGRMYLDKPPSAVPLLLLGAVALYLLTRGEQ